ncbi:hypothetical protein SUZIE_177615 [Sciurus carolinensis]|uniref:Uncharacterized protein n=1 Tax=Sciurus carolinensis TaxID=30640 RepID=A0AA41N5W3_SCICA|nr:uncharacterized protein C12orf60 homolog [Sciurus carolinensis]MBZ3884373.1 hypothetical protein [Sciurus carolinensis]
MSSKSEKDKERLIQASEMFFLRVQDLISFMNTFTEILNHNMNTQIPLMVVKEDNNIKDFFEQMLKNFKEMQHVVEEKFNKMQKEPMYSKVATAMCSMVDKCTNEDLYSSAKEVFKNIQTPIIVSVMSNSNIRESLESFISLLMTFPIMNLQLRDFYRGDTKGQSDATTSEKILSPDLSKSISTDVLKKLQDALKTENANDPMESAADQLEQIVKGMEPTIQVLQNAVKTMDNDNFKKVNDK